MYKARQKAARPSWHPLDADHLAALLISPTFLCRFFHSNVRRRCRSDSPLIHPPVEAWARGKFSTGVVRYSGVGPLNFGRPFSCDPILPTGPPEATEPERHSTHSSSDVRPMSSRTAPNVTFHLSLCLWCHSFHSQRFLQRGTTDHEFIEYI